MRSWYRSAAVTEHTRKYTNKHMEGPRHEPLQLTLSPTPFALAAPAVSVPRTLAAARILAAELNEHKLSLPPQEATARSAAGILNFGRESGLL